MKVLTPSRVKQPMAPRKDFGVHPVQDPYHTAAAYTYRRVASRKKLAYAWKVDTTTAQRYRNGQIVGALTRLTWELVLLVRAGINPMPILRFLLRVVRLEMRRAERRIAA